MRRQKETMPAEMRRMAEAIRDRRLKMGMSQKCFAGEVGISNTTMDNIEAARNWPSMPVYITICRKLKMGHIPLIAA